MKGGINMDISSIPIESLNSVKQALNIATLRKSMNQDAQTVGTLLSDMKDTNSKILEHSVTPHKGGSIDVSV